MKRGQTGIGMVILGVVAIIAVIGLVLLFTRASTTGQVATNYYHTVQKTTGIGQVYGQEAGISVPYDIERSPQMSYPTTMGREAFPPASAARHVKGGRVPVYVILNAGSIEDEILCAEDIGHYAMIHTADEIIRCVSIRTEAGGGAVGGYPRTSSAYPQLPVQPMGTIQGKAGGNFYCYAGSTGAEGQGFDNDKEFRDLMMTRLVDAGHWPSVDFVDDKGQTVKVPQCPIGEGQTVDGIQWKGYKFPQ